VTLEEGLVALLAGAAAILLFVGLAQALDARPARSSVRSRRRPNVGPTTSAGPAAPARPYVPEIPPRAPYTGPERRRSRRPGSRLRPPASPPPPREEPRASQSDLPLVPEAQPAAKASALPPHMDPGFDALERALTLQQEGQHSQVIEAAVPHIEAGRPVDEAEPSFIRAALWTMVGVSRHTLGDIEGAQSALEAALREAPEGASEGCPDRVVAAAGPAARQLLAAADGMSATSGERVAVLRMAVLWLEWRIVAGPATEEVSVLLDRAREALWDGYSLAGRGLMRRRQFARARELIRQALDLEDLPAARRAPLAELAARSIVRQIGRLVATARGTETPQADALDALERGREILAATSVDAVTPGQWHAANRRIWSGYMRLGRRDIVGFELEAALRPLFRALHLRDLDLGLERRTRELLARTVERISDGAGETIDRLLEAGDREAAMQRWQDVRGIIQKARDQGLSHEELAHAFGRARQMLEQIEATKG
jgi:tetratricopeptide (TPR) repeat protein